MRTKLTKTKVIWQKAESLWQVHPTPSFAFARWQHRSDGLAALFSCKTFNFI